ncbi:MAG: NAD(P)/FAD-dependent oxidoreductase, partial [Bacilli bacterium]|nr:NAD(P)/FAD-dependent oxidoreductase [Bacilli bacterium]
MDFFENHGCPLKVERGDRVFPVSDKSSDIIDTLVNECLAKNVVFKYNEQVEKVEKVDENFIVKTKSNTYVCDKLVIATGGASYTSTGSKGDGYKFAKSFNHKITEIKPSLCPIVIEEYIPKEMFDFTL